MPSWGISQSVSTSGAAANWPANYHKRSIWCLFEWPTCMCVHLPKERGEREGEDAGERIIYLEEICHCSTRPHLDLCRKIERRWWVKRPAVGFYANTCPVIKDEEGLPVWALASLSFVCLPFASNLKCTESYLPFEVILRPTERTDGEKKGVMHTLASVLMFITLQSMQSRAKVFQLKV